MGVIEGDSDEHKHCYPRFRLSFGFEQMDSRSSTTDFKVISATKLNQTRKSKYTYYIFNLSGNCGFANLPFPSSSMS